MRNLVLIGFVVASVAAFACLQGRALTSDENAKLATTVSNAKQLTMAMLMYVADWDDVLPYVQDTKSALGVTLPYTKNKSVWKSLNPNPSEFKFNLAIGGAKMSSVSDPPLVPMYYETVRWPDGSRVVAFLDGHVKVIALEKWAPIERALGLKFKRTAKKPLPANWQVGH